MQCEKAIPSPSPDGLAQQPRDIHARLCQGWASLVLLQRELPQRCSQAKSVPGEHEKKRFLTLWTDG